MKFKKDDLKKQLRAIGIKVLGNYIRKGDLKKAIKVLSEAKYIVTSGDFKDDPEDEDDLDFKDLNDAIKFMKGCGLVPKGTGKPTKPSTSAEHDVAWDKDMDTYYLIVYGSNDQGSVWLIDDEKGKAHFVSSFTGEFKPEQGVKIFKNGRYRDYMSLKGIQTVFDIVNPGWSKDASDLN